MLKGAILVSAKGATIRFPGGGAGVFVAGELFISTGLGGALKISHFVYMEQFLK